MTLELSAEQLQAIQTHAEHTYPDECCGLLLGYEQAPDKRLVEVRSLTNAWTADVGENLGDEPASNPGSKTRRYWIAPEDLLKAMRDARQQQLTVIGIYHSHPDHPAVPSECDRQLAWPQYSYLIVSVQQGTATDCRSWILNEQHQFQPEAMLVISAHDRVS